MMKRRGEDGRWSARLQRAGGVLVCGALCAGVLCGCAENVDEKRGAEVLSHGVSILSAMTDVAVSGMRGNDVTFEAEDFARGLNLSAVHSVTVRTLPSVSEGELLLASTRVCVGQTLTGEQIGALVFAAADDEVLHASFTVSVNGSPTSVLCNVYLLDAPNYTPTVSMPSGVVSGVSTFRNMAAHGRLSAYDPDGDALTFEIVSTPQNGALSLTDRAQGLYVYQPNADFVGSDSFSYVARDRYGNYSAAATVEIRVVAPGTSVTYVDMQDSKAHVAALALTEAGVMSGTQVGSQYYFYPDRGVSRAEFLVMAMNAAGITEVPTSSATGFYDDADIPLSMKGYVAAAYAMGYVNGSLVEGELCFLPNEPINRADAAVMLDRVLGSSRVDVIPTFADSSEIPTWAREAIYSLNALGVMDATDGCIAPRAPLTREQTADMLHAVLLLEQP